MRTIYTNIEKTSRFSKGARLYVILLSLLVFGTLVFLWVRLFMYQMHLDSEEQAETFGDVVETNDTASEEAAQNCFEDYLANMAMEDWVNSWYVKYPDHFDKESAVESIINEQIINAGYECFKAPDYNISTPKYLIMKDNVGLAEFNLIGSGTDYSILDVDIMLTGNSSFEAIIPQDCKLLINGFEAGEQYMVESNITGQIDEYNEMLTEPKYLAKYHVEGLLEEPNLETDIAVMDMEGREVIPAVDGMYYPVLYSDEANGYKQKADDFVNALLNYYSRGKENAEGNMASVRAHVVSGSAAASIINNSLQGVVWRVADYSVAYGTTDSDVYMLSDNCYFVDVAYEIVSESNTYETGNGVYRVYFLDEGNGFGIVQFAGIK